LTISPPTAGEIATAVWGAVTRTLTTATGIDQNDIDAIAAAVWTETVRTLTEGGLTTEENTKLMSLPSAEDNKRELLNTENYP